MARYFHDQQNLGLGDVSTALQAILDNYAIIELSDRDYNIGTTGITIPNTVKRITLPPGGSFRYSGTGIAVLVDSHNSIEPPTVLELYGKIFRNALEWEGESPTDTTSMGVRFKNCVRTIAHIGSITGFYNGLDLHGDALTSQGISFYDLLLVNNRIQLQGSVLTTGASSEHRFFGGQIALTSAVTDRTGTVSINLPNAIPLNSWKFYGTSLENNSDVKIIECDGDYHLWDHCRFEGAGANMVHFGTNSQRNVINYGFGNITTWAALNDEGTGNIVNSLT